MTKTQLLSFSDKLQVRTEQSIHLSGSTAVRDVYGEQSPANQSSPHTKSQPVRFKYLNAHGLGAVSDS